MSDDQLFIARQKTVWLFKRWEERGRIPGAAHVSVLQEASKGLTGMKMLGSCRPRVTSENSMSVNISEGAQRSILTGEASLVAEEVVTDRDAAVGGEGQVLGASDISPALKVG